MAMQLISWRSQLREIEIIVAARLEEPDEATEEDVLKKIQEILYQTEVSIISHFARACLGGTEVHCLTLFLSHGFQEGFEVPEEGQALVDEEETF